MLAHDLPGAASIPMWIIILAILAGFLFLSLLIFILYKLGFFQRKRPEDYDYQATIQVCCQMDSLCWLASLSLPDEDLDDKIACVKENCNL